MALLAWAGLAVGTILMLIALPLRRDRIAWLVGGIGLGAFAISLFALFPPGIAVP